MAGAHLDSVTEGPGINDNGSGSAAILETALLLANSHPENTLRFAWWAAEEQGLVGSADYVEGLSQAERERIAVYMNYDMVASPNYVFGVYDADESTFEAPVPCRPARRPSRTSTSATTRWSASPTTTASSPAAATTRPSSWRASRRGSVHRAPRSSRPRSRQAIWGGTAGEQFDPCYHEACDTIANVNRHALDVNSDLIAYAMLTFAYSTESVNGVAGKKVPGKPTTLPDPAGPEGTFAGGGGGLHDHDHAREAA
jgi:Zn-dependent M28 family amino/carboxypeptidase